jgi:uncharacterized protein (TIGR02001 family)
MWANAFEAWIKLTNQFILKSEKQMKILPRRLLTAAIIAVSTAGANLAQAELAISANAGLVSDYYFRGVNLGDAGVYGGIDLEVSGFYAGTWIIDDGTGGNDGLETDFYFGYGAGFGDFSFWVGYSRYEYTYTSDFEQEINLTADYKGFGVEYSAGEMDYDDQTDYDFIALSWSGEVFGATVGTYDDDFNDSYDYVELSASGEIEGFDMTISAGQTSNEEVGGVDAKSGVGYIALDISKTFYL